MKIAVASKDSISINQHFGHAKKFWIYQVENSSSEFLEVREVDHYCLGNTSSQSAMGMILQTINDCEAVLVAKIGVGPTEKLAAIGVKAVEDYAYEEISESLLHYANQYYR